MNTRSVLQHELGHALMVGLISNDFDSIRSIYVRPHERSGHVVWRAATNSKERAFIALAGMAMDMLLDPENSIVMLRQGSYASDIRMTVYSIVYGNLSQVANTGNISYFAYQAIGEAIRFTDQDQKQQFINLLAEAMRMLEPYAETVRKFSLTSKSIRWTGRHAGALTWRLLGR